VTVGTQGLGATPGAADASTWLDLQGLAALRREAATGAPDAVRQVARQFESLFVAQMLKSMRDAKLAESAFDGEGTRFYQDLFDSQVALSLSQGRGLGIADLLARQLAPAAATSGPSSASSIAATSAPAPSPTGAFAATPEEFVRKVLPHARAAAAELGVAPEAIVAQAALETGWGRNVPQGPDGRGYNLFGIKAGPGWSGARLGRPTVEVENGVAVRTTATFRAYDSLGAAFADYVALLRDAPRYAGVRAAGPDPARFAQALQAGGYATDPEYARKILRIVDGDTLRAAVAGADGRGIDPPPGADAVARLAFKIDAPPPIT
jgi:flagellar protein FlgJ